MDATPEERPQTTRRRPDARVRQPLIAVPSHACDAVVAAEKPSPEDGGPCATCAFRVGTEANVTEHTMTLARLCVEGFRTFHCHETPQLCRGFIAALNLRGTPATEADKSWAVVCGEIADSLHDAIRNAAAADVAANITKPKETA